MCFYLFPAQYLILCRNSLPKDSPYLRTSSSMTAASKSWNDIDSTNPVSTQFASATLKPSATQHHRSYQQGTVQQNRNTLQSNFDPKVQTLLDLPEEVLRPTTPRVSSKHQSGDKHGAAQQRRFKLGTFFGDNVDRNRAPRLSEPHSSETIRAGADSPDPYPTTAPPTPLKPTKILGKATKRICKHKIATRCGLRATPDCCACADKRPTADLYEIYMDKVGMTTTDKRWLHYCPSCQGIIRLLLNPQNRPANVLELVDYWNGARNFIPTQGEQAGSQRYGYKKNRKGLNNPSSLFYSSAD